MHFACNPQHLRFMWVIYQFICLHLSPNCLTQCFKSLLPVQNEKIRNTDATVYNMLMMFQPKGLVDFTKPFYSVWQWEWNFKAPKDSVAKSSRRTCLISWSVVYSPNKTEHCSTKLKYMTDMCILSKKTAIWTISLKLEKCG